MRWGNLFRRRRLERELGDEIESNLQLHIDDLVESGLSPAEARRQALIRFGGIEATNEARTERRREEIATRLAIGATRARIFRQLLTESALLAVVGATASVSVAWVCRRLLGAFLKYNPAVLANGTVLGFAVAMSVVAILCFGILPSWRASGLDFGEVTQASGGRATHTRPRLGKALVVVQLGLSLALLIGAGLCLRTLNRLQGVEVGFEADRLLLFTLDPGFGRYDDSKAV